MGLGELEELEEWGELGEFMRRFHAESGRGTMGLGGAPRGVWRSAVGVLGLRPARARLPKRWPSASAVRLRWRGRTVLTYT